MTSQNCARKHNPREESIPFPSATAEGDGQPMYEEVDVVAMSGITGNENALELKDNVAYGTL